MSSAGPQNGIVRFGPFEANLSTQELQKFGTRLRVPNQSFQVLALLLERPGQLVTREEFRQKLWPSDTFVEYDQGLNAAVNRLRDALGDSAEKPRYIETLPRRGYRFVGQAELISNNHEGCQPAPGRSSSFQPAARPVAAEPPSAISHQPAETAAVSSKKIARKPRTTIMIVLLCMILVVAGALVTLRERSRRPDF